MSANLGWFCIQFIDGAMDRAFERVSVVKGLVRQMVRLEVAPDHLDVVEFRRILGQPLDGEPVGAGGQRCEREFAGVDWAVVLDEYHRFGGLAGSGPYSRSSCSRWATKSLLRLVGLVWTTSWRVTWSSEPSIATCLACPGAGTRRSAPALAHTRAR